MHLLKKTMLYSLALLLPGLALADTAAAINSGDTAWMLISSALVLIMTPGLAFFYGGMVRSKNVASTIYQNFIPLGIVGIIWYLCGYSLAFSEGSQFIGSLKYALLDGVGAEPVALAATIPHSAFMLFQLMFAIITPALITGAFAERITFKGWLLFLIIWSVVVYSPVAHWVWGPGGWISAKGALDFAGGTVVHMTAGYSALVAALVFRKRFDFDSETKPYNVGLVALGTALLWFGWFGFNAGSALTSGALAAQAFSTTFFATAAAMLAWTTVDWLKDGKPTLIGGCIGIVAGLVAVTPAAGFVTVGSAIIIGLSAGVICNLAARLIKKCCKIDDTLDVFACHGVGGTIGVITTGLFATKAVNSAGGDGLLTGSADLFIANVTAAVAVAIFSMISTFIIIKIVGVLTPMAVSRKDEALGLDASQHGESILNLSK
jgi:Amt family ammonium transporter